MLSLLVVLVAVCTQSTISFSLGLSKCATAILPFLDWAKQPVEVFKFNLAALDANERGILRDMTTEFQSQPHHVTLNKMTFKFIDRQYDLTGNYFSIFLISFQCLFISAN
jgi:hypothetical protein